MNVSGMASVAPLRVVVVDDSVVVRDRLVALLSDLTGVDVIGTAGDARDGIAVSRRLHPDVVLLDLNLPDGDGVSVLEDVKARAPGTVVVILTNYTGEAYRRRCAEAGADHFLDKSADLTRLIQVLEDLVETRRRAGDERAGDERAGDERAGGAP